MTSNVIFIDWRVEDPQSIVAALPADSAWYILAPNDGGIGQIRRILADYANLDSIQIVSHGSEGAVHLGNSVVDAAGLAAEASALAEIGSALSATGDLLLYGCDVGQGEVGRAFVDALARLTGADVAASADRTGAAALGGNWSLEVASGTIEAAGLTGGTYAHLLPGPPATVSITPLSANNPEGNSGFTPFTFTVSLNQAATATETVDWSVGGTGDEPANTGDFGDLLPSGTVTFESGDSSATVTIFVAGDTMIEEDEGFVVTLSNVSPGLILGTSSTAIGTIENDDLPTVSIAPLSAIQPEGNGGITAFTFTVSLDQPIANFESVEWTVTGFGGHQADAADFGGSLPTGFVTFSYYDTSATVTVYVTGDVAAEFDEGFTVTLWNASPGLAIGTSTADGTILNDDASTVSIAPSSAINPEGNSGTTTFTFAVSLDHARLTSQTVDWTVTGSGNSAASAADFGGSLPSGTVTFAAGDTSETITISVSGDAIVEFDEGFTVTLSNPTSELALDTSTADGTILNDDLPTVSIAPLSAIQPEGNGGITAFTFTVILDQPIANFESVDWAVTGFGGHPADAADFGGSLPTGFVTFSYYDTSATVTIFVSGDVAAEFDEGFTVTLSNPSSGIALGTSTANGTIQNDDASTVSIAPSSAVKPEGNGGTTTFTFTVSLNHAAMTDQTVNWAVTGIGVHAAAAADFGGSLPSGTVTFTAGATTATVDVSVSGDGTVEFDEQFTVTLSNASSGLAIGTSTAGGTIQNDDVSTVSIAPLSASKAEGNGGTTSFTFTVSIDKAGVVPQTVNWAVTGTGAHAANAADFGGSLPGGLVSFAIGETSKTVTVLVSGDTTTEFDEEFAVTLSGPSSGLALGTSTASGTIQNDDSAVASIAPLSAVRAEGNGGTTAFTFTVSLDRALLVDQSVQWTVTGSGGHPASAADFGGTSGLTSFTAGETSATVTVLVTGDTAVEFDEGFTVTLSNASSGLVLGTSSAAGTIQNDDVSTVSIVPLAATKLEGNSGTTSFTFTVSLDKAGVVPQTVNWAVTGTGAHAANAADFGGSLPGGLVSFAIGETSKTMTVLVSGDTTIEFDEEFTVSLSGPSSGLALGTSTASGTIQNDDSAVVSIAPLSAVKTEGNGGTTAFTFTVSLDRTVLVDQSVRWSVTGSGGRPANAADFGGASGLATFTAGETSTTVTVLVMGDGVVEFDEGFTVTLSNASSGLVLGTSSATGTIQNDDVSTVSITPLAATKLEGNSGTTSFTFAVTLSQAGVTSQTVSWAVTGSGAHATNASDFGGSLPSGGVTFAAGETSKTVTISVSADTTVEFDEGFAVTLSGPSSGLALGTSTASATIQNDDRSTVSVAALSAVKPEGNGGNGSFTFTVSLDQAGVSGQTVDWAVTGSGIHAANAGDFGGSLPSGSVSFAAGETSKTVTVSVSGDTAVEFDEDFTIALSNISAGLTLGTSSASGTIQNDDRSIVSIAAVTTSVTEGDSGTRPFTFKMTLDQAGVTSQSVEWTVAGSGAHPADAADFGGALPSGIVTFAAGETTKTVTIDVAGDTALEFGEEFTVALAHPSSGLALGAAATTGTITNDDGLIVSIADLSATNFERHDGMVFFTFTVRLNHLLAIDGPTVDWAVTGSGDHPVDAADFGGILPSGTATFGPNQQVVVVTVLVSGDTLVEFDETFTVTLSNPADGLTIGVGTASGTIWNDDVAVVSIAAASAVKAEGSGGGTTAFTFTVSLDQAGVIPQSVDWSVTGIGAHAAGAGDFAVGMPSGSVTFAAGETSKTVTIEVAADAAVEFNEGFAVTLANASSGLVLGTSSATGTIQNDDKPVASVVAGSASGPEGDSGTTSFTFTVSLDQAGLTSQTIDWTVDGSGLHGASAADFGGILPSGSLTFAAGETSKVVAVTVSGDTAVEFDETFTLTLSNASSGLALGTASAGGTIVNDDRPVVSIAPLSAIRSEGDSGTTSFTFTVSLDQAGVTVQSVAWSVIGTGAHAADAADFAGLLPTGFVTFAAGETSKTVTIDVSGDSAVEFDEGFDVVLSNASPGLAIGASTAGGTIVNDDKSAVSITALSADKPEGNSGSTAFTFRVSLDQAAVSGQTVDWSIAGSGAHPASATDFGGSLPSGSVTFAAGETSTVVTVLVSADSVVEFDEGFTATLSNASTGLVLGTATASGTIRNDDGSTVSIAALAATKPEGDSGLTVFTFTVSLDQAALGDQTVAWSVTGSGAHAADAGDFGGALLSGTITFAAGEASKTVSVAVSGDTIAEFDEGFTVALSNASAGLVLGTASAQGTIQDDDKPVVSVAALAATHPEGNGGITAFTFTLSLSQAAVASQTVAWAVSGAGAHPADATDFGGALPAGIVTFAAGETSKTVTVLVSGDLAPEFDEAFSLALSSPSAGLALGTASASGTIQNDDHDDSLLTIAPLAAVRAEGNGGSATFTFVLSLDAASTQPATVDWTVSGSGDHAANATDFGGILPSGAVTFAPGETSKVLAVVVSGDAAVEFDEGFKVTLSNPSANLDLVTTTAIGTILNDDTSTVSIAAQSAAKPEGNGGTTAFSFVVSLDQAATTSQTVGWSVTGSGAHAVDAADFGGALPSGTVTFAAGETTKTVTLLVSADALPEFNESFDVTLANASAGLALGTATASGTIQNDDLSVSIAALSATKAEGNAGTTPFTFLVTLTGETSVTRSVDYAVSFSGGDPAVSSDFVGNAFGAGTVTFAPGETSKTIVVNVAGDVVKEANETFAVTLSNPSAGVAIGSASATGTILNDDTLPSLPPSAHDDAYIDFPGQALHIGAASGVLFNDASTVPLTASLLTGPAHGTLTLASDGGFDYTPDPGFFGIDSFSYRATGVGSTSDEHALIYVAPVTVGAPMILDLIRLSAEEQVAATYAAFFGRGADAAGFQFWVHELTIGAASQAPTTLFANIASSFAISDEARSLYPFLANPIGASDSQIGAFLDTVYNNLFNRSADAGGRDYWTGEIRQTLAAGKFVGSVLTDIMSGAQNTTEGLDITTLMGKVAVSLSYVHDQERVHAPWTAADDKIDATALLDAVTADPQTVLVGIVQAYNLSLAALARSDGFGGSPGGVA